MKDEVIELLSCSNPQISICANQSFHNIIAASPNISIKEFKNELLNQSKFLLNNSLNDSSSNSQVVKLNTSNCMKSFASDFEIKIKELEEKAKDLRDDNYFTTDLDQNNMLQFNNNDQNSIINYLPQIDKKADQFDSKNNLLIPVRSFSNIVDIKNEENYLKQIKEKLDLQLKETEYLKNELKMSKKIEKTNKNYIRKEPNSSDRNVSIQSIQSNSNGLIDEVVDLKFKLKQSESINHELKKSFKQNITQLQNALRDCVIDKDSIIDKKNEKIKILQDENEELKKILNEHENFFNQHDSFEDLCNKLKFYQDFSLKLRQLLINEENKREKSYFINDPINDCNEKSNKKVTYETDSLFKGLLKCLEDYQGEIKHLKLILKELQISCENKEKQIDEKESSLNEQFNKKCETIRQEYDRLIGLKKNEMEKLESQIDDLNSEIKQLKDKSRKQTDQKDTEINKLKLSNESLKLDLENAQKELNQIKTRFESLRTIEKENKEKFNKALAQLECENEKLNNKCLDLSKEVNESKLKNDSINCQIKKYEQLIDNLNDQIVVLKRDLKEKELNLTELNQNFLTEKDSKSKLDSKCQELELQMNEFKEFLTKHESCESNLNNIQSKLSSNEAQLLKKASEILKLKKKLEHFESKCETLNDQVKCLTEEKSKLESDCKSLKYELNETGVKLQNTSCVVQHTCKANTLLKEEKETLENIIKDNAVKLKTIKFEFDSLNEKFTKLETELNCSKSDNDLLNKKLCEFKKLNESLNNEKEIYLKDLNAAKNELNNSQTSFKNLNKKLNQTICDKDAQIAKLEQSLTLYEKEINLLKQVETLHKNQEESKVIEIANTVQMKLNQKKNKIDSLKVRIANLEALNENLTKEKIQLESDLKNCKSNSENLLFELKKLQSELDELKPKILHYEKSLEKAAKKYAESEKKNDFLKNELIKLKKMLKSNQIDNDIDEKIQLNKNEHENSQTLNKILNLLLANLNINSKTQDETNTTLVNNLKKVLESTIDLEQTACLNYNDETNHESNKALCSTIENKLNDLNNMGLNLKKENHEVTQLLLQQQCVSNSDGQIKN